VTRRTVIALAIVEIAVAYLVMRLALVDRMPYFVDEATHARFARAASLSTHDLFISLDIAKEPLATWLAVVWIKLGFSPLTAVRLVSIAAGLGTVVVTGLLGHRLGGPAVGLAAAALCVVLPFFAVHDVIGIMEPLLTFLLASALLLQLELARRPRLRVAVLLGLVVGAALLTKESGKLALALIPFSLLCFDWQAPDRRRRLATWAGGVGIVVVCAVIATLVLHSSSRWDQVAQIRKVPILYPVRSVHDALEHPVRWAGDTWPIYRTSFTGYLTIPLLVAGLAGLVVALRRIPGEACLLVVWIVAPLAASLILVLFPYPRHVLYLMPPFLVLAAYGLVTGARWLRARVPARGLAEVGVAAGLLLVLGPALLFDGRVLAHPATAKYPDGDDKQYVRGPVAGSPWKPVAALLRERAAGRDVVVAYDRSVVDLLALLLDNNPRYRFAGADTPLARRADFVVTDELPFHDPRIDTIMRRGHFHPILVYRRPRGGATVTLFERG
jgi:4-amino-4-deoxy-L-arabinose transferase-like glycosyltransferase